jgi:hypothetical protein
MTMSGQLHIPATFPPGKAYRKENVDTTGEVHENTIQDS